MVHGEGQRSLKGCFSSQWAGYKEGGQREGEKKGIGEWVREHGWVGD